MQASYACACPLERKSAHLHCSAAHSGMEHSAAQPLQTPARCPWMRGHMCRPVPIRLQQPSPRAALTRPLVLATCNTALVGMPSALEFIFVEKPCQIAELMEETCLASHHDMLNAILHKLEEEPRGDGLPEAVTLQPVCYFSMSFPAELE